jgi:hypothetical protein
MSTTILALNIAGVIAGVVAAFAAVWSFVI